MSSFTHQTMLGMPPISIKSLMPSNVIACYLCDEGSGTSLTDIINSNTLDWTVEGSGGTISWQSGNILRVSSGYFRTPTLTYRAAVMIFRVPESATQYFCGTRGGATIGNSYVSPAANATIYSLDGWGIKPIGRRTNGQMYGDYFANGWAAVSISDTSTGSGRFIVGALTAATTFATNQVEVAGVVLLNTDPTTTQLRQVVNALRGHLRGRGIYLTPADCPNTAHGVGIVGESTSEGTAALSGLADRSISSPLVYIRARNTTSGSTTGLTFAQLSLAAGTANANPPSSASTLCGLEVGILKSIIDGGGDGRRLYLIKAAQGSTYLAPLGTYTNATGGSTSVVASTTRDNVPAADSEGLQTGGVYYNVEIRSIIRHEREARAAGYGLTTYSEIWCDGLNNAYIGTGLMPDAATVQAWLQEYRDTKKQQLGISNLHQILLKPHNPSGGLGGGDADYPNTSVGTNRLTALGYFRTACVDFAAANSSYVDLLDGDDYALNTPSDYVHPSLAGYEDLGRDAAALFRYSTAVVAVA